jgi:hypothetical protein
VRAALDSRNVTTAGVMHTDSVVTMLFQILHDIVIQTCLKDWTDEYRKTLLYWSPSAYPRGLYRQLIISILSIIWLGSKNLW